MSRPSGGAEKSDDDLAIFAGLVGICKSLVTPQILEDGNRVSLEENEALF